MKFCPTKILPEQGDKQNGSRDNKMENYFNVGDIIILESLATKKSVRIKEDATIDANGGQGELARFRVLTECGENPSSQNKNTKNFRLQNIANPQHYLRIDGDLQVSVGGGGNWCNFTAVRQPYSGIRTFALRSTAAAFSNKSLHLGFFANGSPKPANQPGTDDQELFNVSVFEKKDPPKKNFSGPTWLPASGGDIPIDALRGGHEADGRALYICRAMHEGGWHIGKIGHHLRGARIPYGGKEIVFSTYEVLCFPN